MKTPRSERPRDPRPTLGRTALEDPQVLRDGDGLVEVWHADLIHAVEAVNDMHNHGSLQRGKPAVPYI
jgi:hypothetical protein